MNAIQNEENNFQANESVGISTAPIVKTAKISGILGLGCAILAMISLFVPLFSALLFWNFLLLSAALGVFGFSEITSAKNWMSSITWVISLTLILLLFIFAFGSFKDPQALYFYGAFSIIVPILLMITALIAQNLAVWKSLSLLIIPAVFIVSASLASSKTAYISLLLLPVSWGLLGILNYLESKK